MESYYLVSRERVKDFVGREEQLRQILAYFSVSQAARDGEPRVLVLHALGGQGKSQIALEYAHRSRKTYRGIFWVQASSEPLAVQSFESIATKIQVASAVNADAITMVSLVKKVLELWDARWLLIFDNYDEPETFRGIKKFIPAGD